jgi:hypothetical protein
MVVTPVGMKCPKCGTNRGGVISQIRPERYVLAALTALAAGIGASIVAALAGWFIFFVAAPYGYMAGAMIVRASGMKRGTALEIMGGAGMIVGAVAFRLLVAGSLFNIWFLIFLGISTACAVSRIRYL